MQIRTYNPKKPCHSEYSELQFYVLSKGNNAGRPSAAACPNCFTVIAESPETKETLYWLTYAMWRGRAFEPYLRGSVIPFISIRDYRRQLTAAVKKIDPAGAKVEQVVNVLKQLDDQEAKAHERIRVIAQVRQMVSIKLLLQ